MHVTRFRTPILLCLAAWLVVPVVATAETKPNVLLVAVDDLNDWVGCLAGHPDTRTPNIDRLAKRGTLFTNAHCQAPICNPSRTSIMYGMRPSTTGIYDNKVNGARTPAFTRKHVSMPRLFAANGYKTLTTGKVYHSSALPPNDFEIVGPRPGQSNRRDREIQTDRPDSLHKLWDFGPQSYAEESFQDHVDATWAIGQLGAKHDRPFFMALGFYRPHVPFFSPERIHNSPDLLDGFTLPVVKDDDWSDLSSAARELTMRYAHLPQHTWMQKNNNANWKEAVHAYLACVRWTDEQLGRVLDALDGSPHADNTIIVFYSDHGFHLGEKLRWSKVSLWERSTRVPLIISAPGGLKDRRCARTVELLSIYPTLIELCGLSGGPDELEGVSLNPLLDDPEAEWGHPAITTLMKNNHAIRTQRWRYIRYADGTEELYDHENDPNEWANMVNAPVLTETLARLRKHLPRVNVEQIAVQRSGKPNGPRSKRTAWNSREAWNRERAPFDWLFPFVDKNNDGKITTDEYQSLQVYKKTHADWKDRGRKELGMKPAPSNHEIKQQD